MAFTATVLKIMIAGPSDVKSEKAIALERVNYWNQHHAEDKATILYPVQWHTHAAARMGTAGQEIINLEVLKDSDYLIAVFGITLGTPTEIFPSGTVEEIKRHVASGKVAVVFFSTKPLPRDFNEDQLKKLNQFQTECKTAGLYVEFDSDQMLQEKIYQHINLHIQKWKREFNQQPIEQLKNPFETEDDLIVLDELAEEILIAMNRSEEGKLTMLATLGGTQYTAGSIDFYAGRKAREKANFQHSLQLILNSRLIAREAGDGRGFEQFGLTKKGWDLSQNLREAKDKNS